MSLEENKAIEHRFFEEVVNKGELAVIDELFAANFVDHSALPGIAADREGAKQFFAMAHSAFPDFHSTLEDMFAEGGLDAVSIALPNRLHAEVIAAALDG